MLPRKVAFLVWVSNSVLIDKEMCYLGVTLVFYVAAVEGSTKETPRKHPGNTHLYLLIQIQKLTPKRQLFKETPRGVTWVLPSVTWSTVYSVYCWNLFCETSILDFLYFDSVSITYWGARKALRSEIDLSFSQWIKRGILIWFMVGVKYYSHRFTSTINQI